MSLYTALADVETFMKMEWGRIGRLITGKNLFLKRFSGKLNNDVPASKTIDQEVLR